jgi:hypothetical protein
VFWNTSWATNGVNGGTYVPGSIANIYLGPEERGYTGVLRAAVNRLPAGMVRCPLELSAPEEVRGYALRSRGAAVVYLQHSATHATPMQGLRIRLSLPAGRNLQFLWLDPNAGSTWGAGGPDSSGWIAVPDFYTDIALLVSDAAAAQGK